MHVIPMIVTCMLQGTLCDTGIPRTFYGGNICSVVFARYVRKKINPLYQSLANELNSATMHYLATNFITFFFYSFENYKKLFNSYFDLFLKNAD